MNSRSEKFRSRLRGTLLASVVLLLIVGQAGVYGSGCNGPSVVSSCSTSECTCTCAGLPAGQFYCEAPPTACDCPSEGAGQDTLAIGLNCAPVSGQTDCAAECGQALQNSFFTSLFGGGNACTGPGTCQPGTNHCTPNGTCAPTAANAVTCGPCGRKFMP
jgi:hypothetical protein